MSGPLTEDVAADWVLDPAAPRTAYIECAQACGLALLGGPPTVQTALAAHSRGVGQLIAAAVRAGAGRIVVGLGGSSCTDGGRGMIDELAAHARSRDKSSLIAARKLLAGVELIAATDVEHPLLGPMGAAAVFGPQKGADPDTVRVLEQRLSDWAAELNAAAGRAVSDEAGAGAAGGIGAALLALGGRRESGAAIIAEHTRLADDVAAAAARDHRRGPVRRPVAARQSRQRAGRGRAVAPDTGAGAGRPGHPRRSHAGATRASRRRSPSPTTRARCSWPSTTRPTSWQGWPE